MPKTIQIVSTGRDSLVVLDDTGQVYQFDPRMHGFSEKSWVKFPPIPDHQPKEEQSVNTLSP